MALDDVFHTLHHVCIVVRDMDAAVAFYESIGIGPWHEFPSLEMYLGELDVPSPEAFLKLHYRYANISNVQIQLCAPPEGPSPQRAFLESHGEGVFHLGFSVPDCDQAEAKAIVMGLQPKMRGRVASRQGFTYFETAGHGAGVTLEIRATDMSWTLTRHDVEKAGATCHPLSLPRHFTSAHREAERLNLRRHHTAASPSLTELP